MQISAKQLSCIRQGRKLFANLSFELHAGQALIVEGDNGAGKSSLLRLLAGIATPSHGDITGIRPQDTHYISHANGIRLGLTVIENLQLACELSQDVSISDIKTVNETVIETILAQLQLLPHQHTHTQFLSAGQKRRVALARLFLMPRPLWILDEPFTSLDAPTQLLLQNKIEANLQENGVCIITSHQPIKIDADVVRLRLSAC